MRVQHKMRGGGLGLHQEAICMSSIHELPYFFARIYDMTWGSCWVLCKDMAKMCEVSMRISKSMTVQQKCKAGFCHRDTPRSWRQLLTRIFEAIMVWIAVLVSFMLLGEFLCVFCLHNRVDHNTLACSSTMMLSHFHHDISLAGLLSRCFGLSSVLIAELAPFLDDFCWFPACLSAFAAPYRIAIMKTRA
ncbi:hypothetical protein Pelo_18202 [Pelomyxa schiedti]|nr:hypothetical protein Pelo_18202 [Pelomyxa schiedti]